MSCDLDSKHPASRKGSRFPSPVLGKGSRIPSSVLGKGSRFPSSVLGKGSRFPSPILGKGSRIPSPVLGKGSRFPSPVLGKGSRIPSPVLGKGSRFPSPVLDMYPLSKTGPTTKTRISVPEHSVDTVDRVRLEKGGMVSKMESAVTHVPEPCPPGLVVEPQSLWTPSLPVCQLLCRARQTAVNRNEKIVERERERAREHTRLAADAPSAALTRRLPSPTPRLA